IDTNFLRIIRRLIRLLLNSAANRGDVVRTEAALSCRIELLSFHISTSDHPITLPAKNGFGVCWKICRRRPQCAFDRHDLAGRDRAASMDVAEDQARPLPA